MKIDLVYKLGSNSSSDNYSELRYSIRSAVKYFQDLGRIYIIGNKPNWITNVEFVKLEDSYTSCKDANLISKLIVACNEPLISSKFLNMSDDYFFMNQVDSSYFEKAIYHNDILDFKKDHKFTKWQLRLQRTINLLKSKNLPGNNFETHHPQLIDKYLYPKTVLNYDYGCDNGYCGNTLYFNTLKADCKALTDNDLCRLEKKVESKKDIEILFKIKPFYFFNYTVLSYSSAIEQFLCDQFNEKTIYELF